MLNDGQVHDEVIDVDGADRAVLEHFVLKYRHSSREQWAQRIATGEVRLNGDVVTSTNAVLRKGQVLAWHKPPWREPEVPRDVVAVFEDDDLIAVHKPAGLPTLPGAGFLQNTLLSIVRALSPSASPVHRLDRGTSGIVLFAKTSAAARDLQRQWDSGTVDKRYRALLQGVVAQDVVVIDAPIGVVVDSVVEDLFAATPTGKRARSTLRVLQRREHTTLVEVAIETGRPHQIRIHAGYAGHPLVDDPVYGVGGVRVVGSSARPGDGGFLLHAHTLTVTHPRSGERLVLQAPPPAVLRLTETATAT